MTLQPNQRTAIGIGILLICVSMLFPPWFVSPYSESTIEMYFNRPRQNVFIGYSFILSRPESDLLRMDSSKVLTAQEEQDRQALLEQIDSLRDYQTSLRYKVTLNPPQDAELQAAKDRYERIVSGGTWEKHQARIKGTATVYLGLLALQILVVLVATVGIVMILPVRLK